MIKILRLLFFTFFALSALPAFAIIIGVEQFDYPDGAIADRSGGTFWNWRNQTPAARTAGTSDWNGSATVASGRLTTNGSSTERQYNGPGEGLPITTDEGLGAISRFNSGGLSFQEGVVYYRITLTTGATQAYGYFLLPSQPVGTEKVTTSPKQSGRVVLGVP